MKINTDPKTIAQIARELKSKVSVSGLAEKRGMQITNFRLRDGSTIKLLEGANEVDCIVMKKGKVLSAKGVFVEGPTYAERRASAEVLGDRVAEKIAGRKDIEPAKFEELYPIDYFDPAVDYFA